MNRETLETSIPEQESSRSDFLRKIDAQEERGKFLSIGLDPNIDKLPPEFVVDGSNLHVQAEGVRQFARAIIDATVDIAGTFKLNSAFYEQMGPEGMRVLAELVAYIHRRDPDVLVIDDAKRADIGNTNEAYAKGILDVIGADAMTLHSYLGKEALKPFLDRKDKGFFILVRTSNPGAGEFQDLKVFKREKLEVNWSAHASIADTTSIGQLLDSLEPLYLSVARNISESWNNNGNCGLVVGATYPEELTRVRSIAPDLPILIPGIGTQGGDLEKSIRAAGGRRMIINSSSGIIHASREANFAEKARKEALKLHNSIDEIRENLQENG